MSTLTVFIPSFLTEARDGYLYGVHNRHSSKSLEVYYILDVGPRVSGECIGYYYSKSSSVAPLNLAELNTYCISLRRIREDFIVTEIVCFHKTISLETCKGVICIVYNYSKFLRSEILISNFNGKSEYSEHFQKLAQYIRKRKSPSKPRRQSILFESLFFLFACTTSFLQTLSFYFSKMNPIFKYSSLATHIKNFFDDSCWALASMKKDKGISIGVGNYASSIVLDIFIGIIVLNQIMTMVTVESMPQLLLITAEVVVETLLDLLKWLMGVPAGLKLNFAWNNILGKFFMYHINLWWTFLMITKPLLEFTFRMFLVIGKFGVTFQVSILADLFALASFHIYCIYVYAARLYNLQVMGLIALWRLFIGKKWNPLRERVDSCTYSSEQLFVGTLCFTILFFLLPTTLMYYIVFASLRLITLIIEVLLRKVRLLVQSIPIYSSMLWLLGKDNIASTVQLVVLPRKPSSSDCSMNLQITLSVYPATQSWWVTAYNTMSSSCKSMALEENISWNELFKSFFYGRLIYPV